MQLDFRLQMVYCCITKITKDIFCNYISVDKRSWLLRKIPISSISSDSLERDCKINQLLYSNSKATYLQNFVTVLQYGILLHE